MSIDGKVCTKCKIYKEIEHFDFNKCSSDGYNQWCKECKREYYQAHREERLAYRNAHRDKQLANSAKYNREHKEEQKQRRREYYVKNREKILSDLKYRYDNDKSYKLNNIMSKNIWKALKGAKSEQHWEDLVGYSIQELKEHLERLFDENMTWDNMGDYWEIDHIIPVNTFNINSSNDEDFKICWSLANLRPLEKIANRSRPKDGRDIPEDIKQSILSNSGVRKIC